MRVVTVGAQSVPAPRNEQLKIRVVSTHPRVFEVKDFLSDFEAEYMIAQVNRICA